MNSDIIKHTGVHIDTGHTDSESRGYTNQSKSVQKNADGLHYADLDLVRSGRSNDDSEDSYSPRSQPTEYASIRLY